MSPSASVDCGPGLILLDRPEVLRIASRCPRDFDKPAHDDDRPFRLRRSDPDHRDGDPQSLELTLERLDEDP